MNHSWSEYFCSKHKYLNLSWSLISPCETAAVLKIDNQDPCLSIFKIICRFFVKYTCLFTNSFWQHIFSKGITLRPTDVYLCFTSYRMELTYLVHLWMILETTLIQLALEELTMRNPYSIWSRCYLSRGNWWNVKFNLLLTRGTLLAVRSGDRFEYCIEQQCTF